MTNQAMWQIFSSITPGPIAMLTDSTYRDEFLDELTTDMRETFRARAEYLRLCGEAAPAG